MKKIEQTDIDDIFNDEEEIVVIKEEKLAKPKRRRPKKDTEAQVTCYDEKEAAVNTPKVSKEEQTILELKAAGEAQAKAFDETCRKLDKMGYKVILNADKTLYVYKGFGTLVQMEKKDA